MDTIKSVLQRARDEKLSINLTVPTEGSVRHRCVVKSAGHFSSQVFMRWRGECWQVSILVALKEMTLLSGFDRWGPYIFVASENGQKSG